MSGINKKSTSKNQGCTTIGIVENGTRTHLTQSVQKLGTKKPPKSK